MKTFSDKVRDIVRKIPKGKTMTYKAVAAKAGNPKAARAVGAICARITTHRSRVIALLQATAQCAATFVRAVGRPNNDPLDRELHRCIAEERDVARFTAALGQEQTFCQAGRMSACRSRADIR